MKTVTSDMKHLRHFLIILVIMSAGFVTAAQDILPKFSVKSVGNNRIIIGWVNNYQTVKQISIQRSLDSLGIYKTILSVADPSAIQNGYADTKATNDHMYYRLFIMLDKGMYLFSEVKRPMLDSAYNTGMKPDELALNGAIKKPDYVPSVYVYTNADGYLFVNLPDADRQKYHIKFFEEDKTLLFELKNIHEPALTLDKTNFYHAGWFRFELYNDNKLVEENKFYLAKDF